MGESICMVKKLLGLVLMFLSAWEMIKLENNWESTNNLKLWRLNISGDFLLCKIVATFYVADSYKTFSWLTTTFEEWKRYYSCISILAKLTDGNVTGYARKDI